MDLTSYHNLVRRAARAHSKVSYLLDTKVIMPIDVDEISLLFREPDELAAFAHWADRDASMQHFNRVERDRMVRSDGTEFDVRFEFMRLVGSHWRIEAMCVLDGTAPLHELALEDRGTGCVVHASYRAATTESGYENELQRLPQYGVLRAEYRNTYGRFSYWTVPEIGNVYLKPRVNLVDQK